MEKKIPWGVLAWVCVEIVFFLTVGIVAAFLVLDAVAGATSGGVTIFTNWWQTLLFVADLIFTAGFIMCTAMYILTRSARKSKEE